MMQRYKNEKQPSAAVRGLNSEFYPDTVPEIFKEKTLRELRTSIQNNNEWIRKYDQIQNEYKDHRLL